ncbi:MAG: RNA methyltransferase [Methylocystaceae bacterium]
MIATSRKAPVYIALVHYPVYNKHLQVIATSVTNLDIHDISRCARTYQVQGFYIVHPLPAQQALVEKVRSFWQEGYGGEYNPDRKDALSVLRVSDSLAAAMEEIQLATGQRPMLVATDARIYPNTVSYATLRQCLNQDDRPLLLVFGTGYGIETEVMQQCDMILEPIMGLSDYNHLSVRSAVAIIIDRLLGEPWFR